MTLVRKRGSDTAVPERSPRDPTVDLARVFCVLVVVAGHLLLVGVGTGADGTLVVSKPVQNEWWFDGGTWILQVMPLFFVVAGFASISAWRAQQRRGGTASGYVAFRMLRLAQPALPLFLFFVVAITVAHWVGVDSDLLNAIVIGAGSPLWFLAAYALCQALVPLAVRWHTRAPSRTVVMLFVGVLLVDTLQYALHMPQVGYLNYFFVWMLIQQFGFWYADGWFDRRRWWQLVLIAGGAWASLVPLTAIGPYDPDMLANLNPPTLPLVVLGLGQACVLRLMRPALAAIMLNRAVSGIVGFFGNRLMTIYLWHLPVIIGLTALALLLPAASPEPATAAWWWTRIPGYFLVLGIVFLWSLVVGRWEVPRPLAATPPNQATVVAAILTFLPALAVAAEGLDVWIALVAAAMYAATLVLIRWPWPKTATSGADALTTSADDSMLSGAAAPVTEPGNY